MALASVLTRFQPRSISRNAFFIAKLGEAEGLGLVFCPDGESVYVIAGDSRFGEFTDWRGQYAFELASG